MVAIAFLYHGEISVADVKDGKLPESWKSMFLSQRGIIFFSLFEFLAKDAAIEQDKKGEFAPQKIFFDFDKKATRP
jgi:hypothetical protein